MSQSEREDDSEKLPGIVYHPKYTETQLVRFQKMVEKEYNVKFNDYWDHHEWSYKNYPECWGCVWRFFNIICSKPYSQVYDRKNGFDNMEWFKDARLNYAENLLKYRDSETAIIATGYMSNKKEAVFAFLATAAMGAIWCGTLPLLGVKDTGIMETMPGRIQSQKDSLYMAEAMKPWIQKEQDITVRLLLRL
ncbi:Acetoacetyl-CoA synthetase like protein [Argiope bruennichi]|uniref:Acetoacetyl-CoA synthetase like protein n=1 Tax=Argiope bruennichi TaxID=94029 RepID=A0A8T0ECG5_ARGBR|nr:Acetoacetyl-CoA synthetase like protein [Argiope bruennichi]